jgi:hypothetical protein
MAEYNENIRRAIENFNRTIKKAGFSLDTQSKILSLSMSLEYQVEMGNYPPASVIRHLQAAIRSWIETYDHDQKKLLASLNKCVDIILKEIGSSE